MKKLDLPKAPEGLSGPVVAWSEPVAIQTYAPLPADRNPMFLEKRVYQGSSGKIYPLPFTDGISSESQPRLWQAVHIENEFLRVMVLPEIGGRVHVAFDKLNEYDFFYRQNVIKPALVGLAGPWISGGAEFNWPQHHRPATFMPVNVDIEQHQDGSRTIWCGDHDPFDRLKGMHGICLHPGKAYIELKVRLYNRTSLTQTFLWWTNIAVRVHEQYQSFFPPDVRFVADHAVRAMSRFPRCEGYYYGINYEKRASNGIPPDQVPPRFKPPGNYPADDLSWYSNIPVPTSYMAVGSGDDFHGGYDHAHDAGVVLLANHHIAPGKKQWTWGNHPFGYAWDRNLTDDDGPYIELMAGVYTDNQPDFSFLAPGETRTFSQFWYPIRRIGTPDKANIDVASSVRLETDRIRVGVCATREFRAAKVSLFWKDRLVDEWSVDLSPKNVFVETAPRESGQECSHWSVAVETGDGRSIIEYSLMPARERRTPELATEPPAPANIKSNDELYITGLHLQQYRHATRSAEPYWREALNRDPGDSRCNNALGIWCLRRGEFEMAERYFRNSLKRLTSRNKNPSDGEPSYHLGLTLRYLRRDHEAYDAFYKATWNAAIQSAAYLALAELDTKNGDWSTALDHLRLSLRTNADNLNARNLNVMVLRKLGRSSEASALLEETRRLDRLDTWSRYLEDGTLPIENQLLLDLTLDLARAGFYKDAIEALDLFNRDAADGSVPMALYMLAHWQQAVGDLHRGSLLRLEATQAPPDYCFPHRLEELQALEEAVRADPNDARARYYLGNLLYDRRRHREAIALWGTAAALDPAYPTVWRNLGVAYFNVLHQAERAREAFDRAFSADSEDARILYERDQLWKRMGETPQHRLTELSKYSALVQRRDDLTLQLASLYNMTEQPEQALKLLQSRRFQPWEGGEGAVIGEHLRGHLALALKALARRAPAEAIRFLDAALVCPENLGEVPHPLSNQSDIYYWLGVAQELVGEKEVAFASWERVVRYEGDFQGMQVKSFSEMTYYRALALKKLGRASEATEILKSLLEQARVMEREEAKVDYFATSLPTMILFEDDPQRRNTTAALFLQAQAQLGLGEADLALELLSRVLQLDPNHADAGQFVAMARTLAPQCQDETYARRS